MQSAIMRAFCSGATLAKTVTVSTSSAIDRRHGFNLGAERNVIDIETDVPTYFARHDFVVAVRILTATPNA